MNFEKIIGKIKRVKFIQNLGKQKNCKEEFESLNNTELNIISFVDNVIFPQAQYNKIKNEIELPNIILNENHNIKYVCKNYIPSTEYADINYGLLVLYLKNNFPHLNLQNNYYLSDAIDSTDEYYIDLSIPMEDLEEYDNEVLNTKLNLFI